MAYRLIPLLSGHFYFNPDQAQKAVNERKQEMLEDTEQVSGTPDAATAVEDSSYANVLSAEGTDAEASPVSEPKAEVDPNVKPEVSDDPEITLKEGLKAKLSEILEWQKGHMMQKDYTQKTQTLAQERKSLEDAFGGKMPNQESIQNIGKLYQAYFSNERAAQVIDAILTGNLDQVLQGAQGQKPDAQSGDPYIKSLETKIQGLESKLSQFTSSLEQREQQRMKTESKQIWDGWVAKRQTADKSFAMTDEIDSEMGALIPGIGNRHPDWDDSKILDHAYRLATIDKQPQKIAQQILKDADDAKKGNPPKINSQPGQKSDASKSYSDILNE